MVKSKKCGICGFEFTYDDRVYENPYVMPHSEGAKYYYDIWHFPVEKCPQCKYASKDISHTFNKRIVTDEDYMNIEEMAILKELNAARPNRVENYVRASYYYNSIGDKFNEIKCLLQAGDLVYAELMYWEEYIFDGSDSVSALIGKSQQNEVQKLADFLINSGIEKLESLLKNDPSNLDAQLLLAGTLNDGDKVQVMKGLKLLNNLKGKEMTPGQQKAYKFLLDQMN